VTERRTRSGRGVPAGGLGLVVALAAALLTGCAGAAPGPGVPESMPSEPSASSEPSVSPAPDPDPERFDLASIDGTAWCSPTRGDCVEIALPVVAGFGGRSTGTWPPQPADPDGCFRLRGGAPFDLWFCPAGAVVDLEGRPTGIDDARTDQDRLIVKFKAEDGWVYLREP